MYSVQYITVERIYKLPEQKNCTYRTNYMNFWTKIYVSNKFYKLSEQKMYVPNKSYELSEQICMCVDQILQTTRTKNLYVPNKLYELSKQICICQSNSINYQKNICMYQANYVNYQNKYVYVSNKLYRLSNKNFVRTKQII
jgi:hypothetical protein